MTTEEKAAKYDELEAIVATFYPDNEDEMPDEELGDLATIGEKVANFFGYI